MKTSNLTFILLIYFHLISFIHSLAITFFYNQQLK